MKNPILFTIFAFIVGFSVYGYPIQFFPAFILGTNINTFNIVARGLLLIVFLFFFLRALLLKKVSFSFGIFFMLLFWLLYSARLIYDIQIKGIKYLDQTSFFVYSFAFGVSLIPAIATYANGKNINLKKLLKYCYGLIFLSNILLTYSLLSIYHWNILEVLSTTRGTISVNEKGLDLMIVNPITVSFFGELLILTSVYILRFGLQDVGIFKRMLFPGILLGLLNLLLGSSRGPILGVVVIFVFILFLKRSKTRPGKKSKLPYLYIFILFTGIAAFLKTSNFTIEDIMIFNRFSMTYDNKKYDEKEERDYEWESAFNQFQNSPIIGDKFVNDFDQSYTHNLFIDVIMATGIIGSLVFSGFFIYLLKRIVVLLRRNKGHPSYGFFVIIFMAEFLSSMLSGGLFISSSFWMLSALLLGLKIDPKPLNKSKIQPASLPEQSKTQLIQI